MEIKDYVVVKEKNGKPFLIQVTQIDGKTISGVCEEDRRTEARHIEVNKKSIITNLGQKPEAGKVYNIDVSNLYCKSIRHDWWGSIFFYVTPEPATLQVLKTSLDRTAKVLEKKGFAPFLDKFETEIRAKKGKWAGMYVHRPKKQNLVWYAPEWAQNDKATMDNVIYHEFGHVVRFNGLASAVKLRQKWLRLYQQSIDPVVVPAKALTSIWNKLKDERVSDDEIGFGEALRNVAALDEKYAKAIKVLTKWLKQVQHVGGKELSWAWEANDMDYIEGLWPKTPIDSSELTPVISEYATKNVEELFAECFALYMEGKKLPAAYQELMEKSVLWAQKSIQAEQ